MTGAGSVGRMTAFIICGMPTRLGASVDAKAPRELETVHGLIVDGFADPLWETPSFK